MGRSDYIGGRGETIASARLSEICRTDVNLPYFWPHFLGEKCETFDFFVKLVDVGDETPFFFVQVKTTRKGYTKRTRPPRLRVEVSKRNVLRMASFPAPTYLIGVHEVEERAFIIAVTEVRSRSISSMTTAYELTNTTLRQLWEEVQEFWRDREMTRRHSFFSDRGDP